MTHPQNVHNRRVTRGPVSKRRIAIAGGVALAFAFTTVRPALASSHREAPAITEDPVADLTDVYAFASPDSPNTTTFVMNVNPFELPAGGPNFHKFGDDVLYEFKVDNNGDAVEDVTFQYRFKTTYTNPNTFLYNTGPVKSLTDPNLNVRQSYTLTMKKKSNGSVQTLASDVPVAPANIGPRSTPNYDALAKEAARPVTGGAWTFAGPRDDPFFADLGSIFDLGGLRPLNSAHLIKLPTETGKDYLAGFNVHSIVLQVPNATIIAQDPVVGVWATTSRRAAGATSGDAESWKQIARLGMPLVNEVVVPIGTKDKFNSSEPRNDGQYAPAVLKPELAGLIPVLYPGVNVPTSVDLKLGLGGREDIATIFLTGIPGVNQPKGVKPAEMLRINTSVAKSGFPNGRALADDVVDAELQALAGATAFSPAFNISPNNILGDGVSANDKPFSNDFPFLAAPTQGYASGTLTGK